MKLVPGVQTFSPINPSKLFGFFEDLPFLEMRDGKEILCHEGLEIYRILFYQRSLESLVTFVHHFLSWHVDWNVVVASIGMDGTFD